MQLDSLADHLAFLNLQPWSVAILIPVAGMIFAGVIIVCTMYYNNRRRELWHETARLALEKGQPLPALPSDDAPPARRHENRGNDIRDGLICIGVGVGLYLFLGSLVGRSLGYVGAIPGFIGVALLLHGVFAAFTKRKNPESDALPPRS